MGKYQPLYSIGVHALKQCLSIKRVKKEKTLEATNNV